MATLKVNSGNTVYSDTHITSSYSYTSNEVTNENNTIVVTPKKIDYTFRTDRKAPKLGVMLVGWGGNNGTTFTAGVVANREKLVWETKKGMQKATYFGSITQSSTAKIGVQGNKEVFLPLKEILPLVNPDNIVVSGWDISKLNLADSVKRAQVVDLELQRLVAPFLKDMVPLPGIYYEEFIAANQKARADNALPGKSKKAHLEKIRADIKNFKEQNKVDKVIVLWTANTERFCELTKGVHDTYENLLKAIENDHPEVSPSTIYALATIQEGSSFINGSPQNTLVNGVIQAAEKHNVFIIGDDFKSGQTKFKTAFTDFLVTAGIKPLSIVSYNHLGNNDGYNLSSASQFKSKETSKSGCVTDILHSNRILYDKEAEVDHCVVIKYVPNAGDSKKAIDEYESEIFLGGKHLFSSYNVCEDSLLAAPLILDLILLTELFERIEWKAGEGAFRRFHSVLSTLGYLCKAPLTCESAPLVNSLYRQKNGIDNLFKVCAGIPVDDNLLLEFRCLDK